MAESASIPLWNKASRTSTPLTRVLLLCTVLFMLPIVKVESLVHVNTNQIWTHNKGKPLKVIIDPSYELVKDAAGGAFVSCLFTLTSFNVSRANTKTTRVFQTVFGMAVTSLFLFLTSYIFSKIEAVRYKVDDEGIALVKADGSSLGEHPLFTGQYSWKWNEVVNYRILGSEQNPMLLYIKEIHTPPERRIAAPFDFVEDNVEGQGQTHFFPMIGSAAQLRNEIEERGCKKAEGEFKLNENPVLFVKGLAIL